MNSSLPEKPFFIIGHPRSGTTLMRFILSSHPRLFIPAETGFLPFLDTDPTAFLTMDQVGSILDRIGRMNLDWANLVTDLSVFYTSLPVPNLPQTINALYQIKVASHLAPRWGDKTPSYVQYMPVIQKIFPQAQFIHIIRDGRDAALSAIDKWGSLRRAYLTDYYLLAHWVRNVEQGRKFGQIQKEKNYFEVQYEDLVQDPESTIRGICDFLDESFHPNLLDHTPLALQTIGSEGHVEVKAPIRTTSLRRWEAEMEPFRKKLADNLAGPTLRALGYPLSNLGRFRYSEKIKWNYYVTLFWITDIIRTALQQAGWLKPNRGKRRKHPSKIPNRLDPGDNEPRPTS